MMANVVMEMETGRMSVDMLPVDSGPDTKIRKYPDVPEKFLAQAKELEQDKQALAKEREAADDSWEPDLQKKKRKLLKKLHALRLKIYEIQHKAITAKHAKERLKKTEAAERTARRAGNAS